MDQAVVHAGRKINLLRNAMFRQIVTPCTQNFVVAHADSFCGMETAQQPEHNAFGRCPSHGGDFEVCVLRT